MIPEKIQVWLMFCRCSGVHVWPMMFDHSIEVEPDSIYVARDVFHGFGSQFTNMIQIQMWTKIVHACRLSMESVPPTEGGYASGPVETVWGGRGVELATTERPGLRFREPSSVILVCLYHRSSFVCWVMKEALHIHKCPIIYGDTNWRQYSLRPSH